MKRKFLTCEEALQICLDLVYSGQATAEAAIASYPEHASQLRELIEAAIWLQNQRAAVAPRPGFVPASRARLVNRIRHSQAVPQPVSWLPRTIEWLGLSWKALARQAAVATMVLAGLLLISNALLITVSNSLPGEGWYSAKLASEQVQLAFAWTPLDEAQLQMGFAERRANEINELILENHYGQVSGAISRYEQQIQVTTQALAGAATASPQETMALTRLYENSLAEQQMMLHILASAAPPETRDSLDRALQATSSQITSVQALEIQITTTLGIQATPTSSPVTPGQTEVVSSLTPPSYSFTSTPTAMAVATSTGLPPTAALSPTFTLTLASPTPAASSSPTASSTPASTNTPRPSNTPKPSNTPRPPNTHKPPTDPPKPSKTPKP